MNAANPRGMRGQSRHGLTAPGGAHGASRERRRRFVARGWPLLGDGPTMTAINSIPELAMVHSPSLAGLSPVVVVHLFLAVGALVLGPLALSARKGSRWHRASGYAWVTLMLGAALSAVFIRDFRLPNLAGFTPIHLLVLVTFAGVGRGLYHIVHRQVGAHRKTMWFTYLGACVGAGSFALLPGRYLGDLLWHHALGWV
jgi:uncharacterized membrane protein